MQTIQKVYKKKTTTIPDFKLALRNDYPLLKTAPFSLFAADKTMKLRNCENYDNIYLLKKSKNGSIYVMPSVVSKIQNIFICDHCIPYP